MAASLSMWILLMAVKVLPWRWSASYIMIGYLLLAGIIILFVPPAIRGLAQAEQLNFRRAQEVLPQVARAWPIGVVYSAIALDILRHRAQRKAWSTRKFTLLTALITLPGFLPIALAIPYIFVGIFLTVGALGFILSVLLGLGGSFVGIWLGERTGESLLEQESGVVQERVVA
jgi:MFS family permease